MKTYILISGATGGLGSAFVYGCARRGYNLYLTDVCEEVIGFAEYISSSIALNS